MTERSTRFADCYSGLGDFKICSPGVCVPVTENCPCNNVSDYQCSDGTCVSTPAICDGINQCSDGEDEMFCQAAKSALTSVSHEGLSGSVIAAIVSVCVLLGVALVVTVCLFLSRRHKSDTSRDSQSSTEPLKKSYITSDFEAHIDDCGIAKPRATTFYRKIDSLDDNSNLVPSRSNKNMQTTDTPKTSENAKSTLGSGPKIHDINSKDKSSEAGQCVGQYTFRPRLKYTNCNQLLDLDKAEREKLYVINSYKHCSGKSLLPTVMTFDQDPEHFSNKFAKEFLCASTPRQNAKHLSTTQMLSSSIESIDAEF